LEEEDLEESLVDLRSFDDFDTFDRPRDELDRSLSLGMLDMPFEDCLTDVSTCFLGLVELFSVACS